MLLTAECHLPGSIPDGAISAHARGESLVPWCPGVSWFWPSEMSGNPPPWTPPSHGTRRGEIICVVPT